MSLLAIRTFDDPVLRKNVERVKSISEEIKTIARDMLETMYFSKGIGLAAPQVGEQKSIITVDISQENDSLHPMVLINPEIVSAKGEIEYEEGCLSVPGFNGSVIRPEQITVKFTSLKGERQSLPCKGLLARVIQHEIDHLNGVLFTDYLDQVWWDSEEGQRMQQEHPKFSLSTKKKKNK